MSPTNRNKTPWPTKAVMEQIYERHLWGGKEFTFYSGEGSHAAELVLPYLAVVQDFLSSLKQRLSVCDLGCGDFNVGKELVAYSKKYIAIDVVQKLIDHNTQIFQSENLKFLCQDLVQDELPKGDCAILRQVLQHLSNSEIQTILNKLSNFQYVIITEHLPNYDFVPNQDIISGQGIRLKKQSGLDLLSPPFNWKVKTHKELLSIPLNKNKEKLVTTLYEL